MVTTSSLVHVPTSATRGGPSLHSLYRLTRRRGPFPKGHKMLYETWKWKARARRVDIPPHSDREPLPDSRVRHLFIKKQLLLTHQESNAKYRHCSRAETERTMSAAARIHACPGATLAWGELPRHVCALS